MFNNTLFVFVIYLLKIVNSANILAISTLASPSHLIFHDVYLKELSRKGHNITYLGHDKSANNQPNYTQIIMEGVYNEIKTHVDLNNIENYSAFDLIKLIYDYLTITCEADFKSDGLKFLNNYPKTFKFDLIIWDINSVPCLYPLVEKFGNPPVIATNPYLLQPNYFKNIYQSFIPNMVMQYDDRMTLFQRITSNFWNLITELLHQYYNKPKMIELSRQYFGETQLTLNQFERDILLVLTNYNPIANYVEAFPPNIIGVGGLHIKPSRLPADLQEILDRSTNGVILVSFGTNVQAENLDPRIVRIILSIFRKLPQTIIWKFNNDDGKIVDLPENVYFKKWITQIDILLHPNTILFISHCGMLSLQEIFYSGVPVVGIPFFLDQYPNAKLIESRGIGKSIRFDDINTENFQQIIDDLIGNETYRKRARNLSKLYNDVQNTPLETAIWWTEYVLRHGKHHHLDLATRDLNFIEFYNLDIILGPFIFILLILYLLKPLFSIIISKIAAIRRISKRKID